MKNCVILGSGRSGTSALAGMLHAAGYDCGADLFEADEGNAKGYFESAPVVEVNEQLLAQVIPRRWRGRLGDWFTPSRFSEWLRWLAAPEADAPYRVTPEMRAQMVAAVSRTPFCMKDPRFCHTLAAWEPLFDGAVFVCIFRDPVACARSMWKEAHRVAALRRMRLRFTHDDAFAAWLCCYERILWKHRPRGGKWLFIRAEHLFDGSALPCLSAFLDAPVSGAFLDRGLFHAHDDLPVPERVRAVYGELCGLAGAGIDTAA